MIAAPRRHSTSPPDVRVVGVGNAGVHLIDRLVMRRAVDARMIAVNTDAQSLASCIAADKVLLGEKSCRGLGAGGDPELGAGAADESRDILRKVMDDAGVVFVCAGMGGGTGSGVVPILAEMARENNTAVVAVVTTPFAFEGRRRAAQALEGIARTSRHAQGVVNFPNDRMSELAAPRAGIEETFASADALLVSCVEAVLAMISGHGPMEITLGDFLTALRGGSTQTAFGFGASTSDNRAHEAVENALKSPLVDRGRLLGSCHALVAHIVGPQSLSFAEVSVIMQETSRHIPESARFCFGVSTSQDPATPVSVTLIGNLREGTELPLGTIDVPEPTPRPQRTPKPAAPEVPDEPLLATEPTPRPAPAPEERKPAPKPTAPKAKQETLQFEPVARGRFEKSEPTIVEGEDLDVPTFLRMRNKN